MSRYDEHAWRAGIEAAPSIPASALKPSTCKRPVRKSWLARLLEVLHG